MADVTRGIKLQVKLDGEKEYKEALANLNAANRVLSTEMKKLQAQYKDNLDSTEYLTEAGKLLERQLLSQQEKVAKIRERYEEAVKQLGESSTKTMEYKAALNQAETAEINLQHAIEENNAALRGENETMAGLGDTVDQLAGKLGINLPNGAKDALNGMKGLSAGTVAAMTAAAAAVAAVIKIVKELGEITLDVAAQVDEYLTESQITGISEEILQALDYSAPLIDVDAEAIKGSLTKLIQSMDSARDGNSGLMESFDALGVSVTNSDGTLRDSQEVFGEVIDALGQMENETERNALAQDLLGKSAQELNPLINVGSAALQEYAKEAQAAGYILDKEQIQKLAAVDDAYQKLQLTIEGNKKQLAADFAPAAEAAMKLFSDAVQKAGEFLERSGLVENLASIIESLIDILRTIGELLRAIPGFTSALDGLKVVLGAIAQFAAVIADLFSLLKSILTLDFSGVKNALGFGYNSGNANNLQRVQMRQDGFLEEYDSFYGRNASGNDNWRGGLTWVGESGPELVGLPGGSRIYSAQDSRALGGDTFYITIDAASVREFNDIVEMAQAARVQQRMR